MSARREEDAGARIFGDELEQLRGIFRVERDVGGSGSEDREDADDRVGGTRGANGDPRFPDETAREAGGAAIEFAVGQRFSGADDRDGIARMAGDAIEEGRGSAAGCGHFPARKR